MLKTIGQIDRVGLKWIWAGRVNDVLTINQKLLAMKKHFCFVVKCCWKERWNQVWNRIYEEGKILQGCEWRTTQWVQLDRSFNQEQWTEWSPPVSRPVINGKLMLIWNLFWDYPSCDSWNDFESSSMLHQFYLDLSLWLQDIWQLLHPTGKAYSYFISIHHVQCRIDFSLMSSNPFLFILDCSIWNILILYHAVIQSIITFLRLSPGKRYNQVFSL